MPEPGTRDGLWTTPPGTTTWEDTPVKISAPDTDASSSRVSRPVARLGVVTLVGGAMALAGALPASAHVTVDPETASGGDYGVITFRVPNESSSAGTTRLDVTFPADKPISSVRTEPLPGWTARVEKVKLPTPVPAGEGRAVTEAVRSVSWTAQPGTRIGPTEFAQFRVSAGPLPPGPADLVLPAVQTYDNGRKVAWSEPPGPPGAPEPEHPAPTVHLTAADAQAGDPSSTDTTARWLGGAGLIVGLIGLGVGATAVLRGRRGNPTS